MIQRRPGSLVGHLLQPQAIDRLLCRQKPHSYYKNIHFMSSALIAQAWFRPCPQYAERSGSLATHFTAFTTELAFRESNRASITDYSPLATKHVANCGKRQIRNIQVQGRNRPKIG